MTREQFNRHKEKAITELSHSLNIRPGLDKELVRRLIDSGGSENGFSCTAREDGHGRVDVYVYKDGSFYCGASC